MVRTADDPWLSWSHVQADEGDILAALGQHLGPALQAVVIALAADDALRGAGRVTTPWVKGGGRR